MDKKTLASDAIRKLMAYANKSVRTLETATPKNVLLEELRKAKK